MLMALPFIQSKRRSRRDAVDEVRGTRPATIDQAQHLVLLVPLDTFYVRRSARHNPICSSCRRCVEFSHSPMWSDGVSVLAASLKLVLDSTCPQHKNSVYVCMNRACARIRACHP